jgi:hypothetical protein
MRKPLDISALIIAYSSSEKSVDGEGEAGTVLTLAAISANTLPTLIIRRSVLPQVGT